MADRPSSGSPADPRGPAAEPEPMAGGPADDLDLPIGLPGSGRARYAAAMARYAAGQMSARELEVYRIAAARDGEDVADLLALGVAARVPG